MRSYLSNLLVLSLAFALPSGPRRAYGFSVSPLPAFSDMLFSPSGFPSRWVRQPRAQRAWQPSRTRSLPCITGINRVVTRRTPALRVARPRFLGDGVLAPREYGGGIDRGLLG